MKKVSIIVPVYNTKKEYLENSIESLINQTYIDIEIIIIDDGSKRETAQLCDKLAKKDNRIKVFHKQNEGVSIARNVGIKEATGEWVIFVDSDDWIEENAVEFFVKHSDNVEVVIGKDFIDNKKQERGYDEIIYVKNTSMEMIDNLFLDNPKIRVLGAVWGKMYLKEFLLQNDIIFERGIKMGEDYLFNFEVFYKAQKILFIPEYIYHYRSDDNLEAVTKKFDKNLFEKYDILFNRFEIKFGSLLKDKFKVQYNTFVIRQLEYICRTSIYNSQNLISNIEKERILKQLADVSPYNTAIKEVKLKYLYKKKKILTILLRLRCFKMVSLIYKIFG